MQAQALQPTAPGPVGTVIASGAASRYTTKFHSQRAADAEAYLRRLWGAVELRFGPGLTLDQRGFEFAGLSVRTTRFGAAVSGRSDAITDDPGSQWIFLCNLSDDSHARYRALAAGPGEATMMRLGDFAQAETTAAYRGLSLAIDDADLLAAQRALHGADAAPGIGFERKMPAGSTATKAMLRAIDRLATTPGYTHRHAVQLERALKESTLFELLLAWPGTAPDRPAPGPALPASTRLARDYIHAHLADLPTIADVAAHCRVGVRALDRGFRKHLGVSPWQYMLALRLQAVRDDLQAQRHGGTVTEVALHWGFSNLGTFAARYREHFGERPSDSLRQARFRFQTSRSAAGSESA